MKRRWIINNKVRSAKRVKRAISQVFPGDQVLVTTSIQNVDQYMHRFSHDLCIIVGGDGTWSRALAACKPKQILGYFPAGTLNQSATELNQSNKLSAWRDWHTHEISVGRIKTQSGEKSFFMMLGAGVEADAVHIVRPRLKRLLGKGAYIIALLERLLRPVRKTITVNAGDRTWHTSQVLLLNGKYYGQRQITAVTDVFQLEYTLIVWKSAGRINWLCGMFSRMLQWKNCHLWTDEIKIDGDGIRINGETSVQIDGDPGPKLPLVVCKTVGKEIAVS